MKRTTQESLEEILKDERSKPKVRSQREYYDLPEQSTLAQCLSPNNDPVRCYRVRCQLGKKCVVAASNPPSEEGE